MVNSTAITHSAKRARIRENYARNTRSGAFLMDGSLDTAASA